MFRKIYWILLITLEIIALVFVLIVLYHILNFGNDMIVAVLE